MSNLLLRRALVAVLLTAVAAPAMAQQQTIPAPAQANPPMFKEPLSNANLFPQGKRKKAPEQPGQAQPGQGKMAPVVAPVAPAPFKQRFFDKLDVNNDGIVTRDEFLAQANRQFNALDLNHDGRLTQDEIGAAVAKAQTRADANGKGDGNANSNSNAGSTGTGPNIGAGDLVPTKRKYRTN